MATIALQAIEPVKTISGNNPQTYKFEEAASQTFLKGAILTLNASGHVTEAGTDPARILGIAAENAHNDSVAATNKVAFWVANEDTLFCANVQSAGANTITALTMRGQNVGVVKNTNGTWQVDVALATHARRAIIQRLDQRDSVGDTNGRVHFQFMSQTLILSSTS